MSHTFNSPSFIISENEQGPTTIQCLICGMVSYNRNDIINHYCGHCHIFHDYDAPEFRAKLAAAAPEMFVVIKELYEWAIVHKIYGSIFPKLEAAYKKATGN